MAGDWIKVEKATMAKPEVLAISEALQINPVHAFGLCVRFWMWCDDQLSDGNARGVTKVTLDFVIGHDGMTDALLKVGWLRDRSGSLEVPHFDRHLSEGAKNRALTKERVRKSKIKSNGNSVTTVTHGALPEKRREENSNTPLAPPRDVDEWTDKMPTANAKLMENLQRQINSLHPSWSKRPHFSAKELHALCDNAKAWLAVTDEDWRLLSAYMAAKIPDDWRKDPRDFFQPDIRIALINGAPTMHLGNADKWANRCRKLGIPTGMETDKKTA